MHKPEALKAARTSISAPRIILSNAQERARRAGFSKFSDYVEALFRADERHGFVAAKASTWKKIQLQHARP